MPINKKALQLLATLWILIFHLWINISGSAAEEFIIRIGYVGVDIFFFVSAYSMSKKEIDYKSFMMNRFLTIYSRFALFVVVAAIYKQWALGKTLKILFFVDFFQRGGGSFLWFIPAIMLLYALFPLFLKLKVRYKSVVALLVWMIAGIVLEHVFGYRELFIFLSRIPIVLAGYWACKWKKETGANRAFGTVIISTLLCAFGIFLLYVGGFHAKLNVPFHEVFYVLAMPFVLGVSMISKYIPDKFPLLIIGDASFEIYAIQMIFGTKIVNTIYSLTNSKWMTNLFVFAIVFLIGIVISFIWKKLITFIKKLLSNDSVSS